MLTIADLYNVCRTAMALDLGDNQVFWENDQEEGKIHLGANYYLDNGDIVIYRREGHE